MKDFIELIKDNVKNYPSRIAIIDGEKKISYADFFALINSISHQLISKNNTPKVIIDLGQGIEAYALIFAVLNVGGTYCPLHPDAPIERKMQIIDEFEPDFIVAETREKALKFNSNNAIAITSLVKINTHPNLDKDYNGEDIIYVIYTSGSTGMPKGVKICRKALNKFLEWSIPAYGANENDIWGQYSFLSFDLSIVDIFTCLCSGSTLFAMNNTSAKKHRPAGIIEKEKITIWQSIPSTIEFMIVNEMARFYDFSSLRLMSFCGEPLRKNHVEFLFKKKEDLIIFNTYGPTEGTLFCTWQELKSDNYLKHCEFSLSIGSAIPGWNLKFNDTEDFAKKEVLIYGHYIGKGYLGNSINSGFTQLEIDGEIMNAYETGDLVTISDNNLYFAGRKDRQVKIKGNRIELEEIDFRINEFLKKTSVTVVKNNSIYSFIESDKTTNEEELREYLEKKLEAIKVPNSFYTVKQIPRSGNQKVDYSALIELIL